MTLTKKHRIILFVILSFIYILFFSLYSAKALTNVYNNIDYYYYDNGNKNNATMYQVSQANTTTITLFDMNFYTAGDNANEENYFYNMVSSTSSGNGMPMRYFSFVFYSLEDIGEPDFDLLGANYSSYCNILNTIQNEDINFYINTCSLPETQTIYLANVYFNQDTPTLSYANHFAFSDFYSFDNEEDLIEFISRKQAEINKTIEGNETDKILDTINSLITNYDINDSGWGASISFWNTHNSSNSVITNVITLPITLLQSLLTNASDTCTSFSLGSLYNKPLSMPCIDLSRYLGNSLITIIDTIFAGFIIYNCGKKFVKIFDDLTNLRDNQINELYGGGK